MGDNKPLRLGRFLIPDQTASGVVAFLPGTGHSLLVHSAFQRRPRESDEASLLIHARFFVGELLPLFVVGDAEPVNAKDQPIASFHALRVRRRITEGVVGGAQAGHFGLRSVRHFFRPRVSDLASTRIVNAVPKLDQGGKLPGGV